MFLAVIPMLLSHMAALVRPAAVAALEREGRAPFFKKNQQYPLRNFSKVSTPEHLLC